MIVHAANRAALSPSALEDMCLRRQTQFPSDAWNDAGITDASADAGTDAAATVTPPGSADTPAAPRSGA